MQNNRVMTKTCDYTLSLIIPALIQQSVEGNYKTVKAGKDYIVDSN